MSAFVPSAYQQAVFDFVERGRGDAVVSAVAGSGKSTTLMEIAKRIRSKNVIMFAFNVHIVAELQKKIAAAGIGPDPNRPRRNQPPGVEAMTIHGYGYRALNYRYKNMQKPDDAKYKAIAHQAILAALEPDLQRQLTIPKLRAEAEKVVKARVGMLANMARMARLTLADPNEPTELGDLIAKYDLGDVDGPEGEGAVMRALPGVLEMGARAIERGVIDFTDMVWGPLRLGVRPWRWDAALVDEAQDLSAAQRELLLFGRGPGARAFWVGDPYQAIMGFAGADADSYNTIKARTGATELPLSICYRCPESHIALAKRIVPHIEARPGAKRGVVDMTFEQEVIRTVKEGDLILCRMTAPLVSMCLQMIRRKLPARVRGRDVAKGLVDLARTIEKIEPDYGRFPATLDAYTRKTVANLQQVEGSDEKVQRIQDMTEALSACYMEFFDCENVDQLADEIAQIFTDGEASIWLSTIHRAKGLEADRVFLLKPDVLPLDRARMTPEQRKQEWNLFYVGLTRAKEVVSFVYETVKDIPDAPVVPVMPQEEGAW